MNKNQIQGKADEATGKIKEVTGKLIGDKQMETEGKAKKVGGKIEGALGDIKENVKKNIP